MSRIVQSTINWSFAEPLAWKRSGFKDRATLENAVRDLPLKKKMEMLTEIHMREMAEILFEEKQEFLLSLGKKTWVDADESYRYAKKTYKDKQWDIDEYNFHPMCVFGGSHTNQMNTVVMERVQEKRKKK